MFSTNLSTQNLLRSSYGEGILILCINGKMRMGGGGGGRGKSGSIWPYFGGVDDQWIGLVDWTTGLTNYCPSIPRIVRIIYV